MTLHAAKGLEFDTVFLAGWEEGLFPHPRSLAELNGTGVEEERRLAYVGLSRARKRAIVSYAYSRRAPQGWQSAQPSRFIFEIPSEVVVHHKVGGLDAYDGGSHNNIHAFPNESRSLYNNPRPQYAGNGSRFDGRKSSYPAAKPRTINSKDALSTLVTHSFKTGDRVFHDKFGGGNVVAFEGDKLLIQFDANGLKKIIADFVIRE
jgi:DNA helicase-2/ATP-dependent DNA helicase PcrA